jgi:hypothetical protein
MERGEFDSPLFMGDADIALMRHGAAKHRRWARELRLSLVRASVTAASYTTTRPQPTHAPQTSRPRERRPRRRSASQARAPSRDPDEPAPPLGRLSPIEKWGGVVSAAVHMHAHVLRRAAAMRTA